MCPKLNCIAPFLYLRRPPDQSDPDSLYGEYVGKAVPIHRELADTSDGQRAFEIVDNSGYELCFGRLCILDGDVSKQNQLASGRPGGLLHQEMSQKHARQ